MAMFHFSQRYPKIPVVASGAGEERMGIAFDLMSAPLSLLPVLPRLLPPLRALFKEEEADEDDEAEAEDTKKDSNSGKKNDKTKQQNTTSASKTNKKPKK